MNSLRNLINLVTLLESPVNDQALANLKSQISGKIKELPPDDASIKALREIEDLLRHVNAGGMRGIIKGELDSIPDATVHVAQKELARFIYSIDMDPDQRDELFSLWRSDKLVKRNVLLSPGKHNFSEIITSYESNSAIKELVNEFMRIAALGQGKGEFGLSVLSKSINKQKGKGDLDIDGRAIEVKTTDGGAGRFTDQEVRPGEGFEQAAKELRTFMNTLQPVKAGSGANLDMMVEFHLALQGNPDTKKDADTFLTLFQNLVSIIFDGEDVSGIVEAVKAGSSGRAMQEYARTNFNYYMSKKHDEGVLYISLAHEPIMTAFFRDIDELDKAGLRLHAKTVYPASIKDVRLPYPQIEIVDIDGGAGGKGKAGKSAPPKPVATPNVVTGKPVDIRPIGAASAPNTTPQAGLGRERR